MPEVCPSLPAGLVESGAHTNTYCLTAKGKISVARLLTCFAYNQPDIQYCPILYPLAAAIRHYLTGNRKKNQYFKF